MADNMTCNNNSRMFTTHGRKKNQGKWARVNDQLALVYTEGKGEDERIIAYTPFEDMVPMITSGELPEYQVDF